MSYLNRENYELLYERYLERGPESLLDAANLQEGENVLDLCGGSGRLAVAARKHGAGVVVVVDEDFRMANGEKLNKNVINFVEQNVVNYLCSHVVKWNVIFSQQAINYWLNKDIAKIVAIRLSDGGRFVFNTFHHAPPAVPTTKTYQASAGHVIAEMYYCVNNVVHHFQARDGCEPHYTSFRYISPKEYKEWLSPFFDVEIIRKGKNSAIYVCRKR